MRGCIQEAESLMHNVLKSRKKGENFGMPHCLPQKLKSTYLEIISNGAAPDGACKVNKLLQKC